MFDDYTEDREVNLVTAKDLKGFPQHQLEAIAYEADLEKVRNLKSISLSLAEISDHLATIIQDGIGAR